MACVDFHSWNARAWNPRCLRLIRTARRIATDQNGSTLIEAAVILPVLLMLMTGIIDMGFTFAVQNNMTGVSQDAARLVAIGNLTEAEAETYAGTKLMSSRLPYTIDASTSGNDVTVNITVPYNEVMLVDFLGLFKTGNLQAQSVMRVM